MCVAVHLGWIAKMLFNGGLHAFDVKLDSKLPVGGQVLFTQFLRTRLQKSGINRLKPEKSKHS